MIPFSGRGILLDIEGTTSSIRFVYDVMFPYARRELPRYLESHWESTELEQACQLLARDAGCASFAEWVHECDSPAQRRRQVCAEVLKLMDNDAKTTGLKQLQGLIWRAGFESGEMKAHVYQDVPGALAAWNEAGWDVRVYSSGSIAAQQLFFAHTIQGSLLQHFRGHYDTTTGPKKEAASYQAIAAAFALPPDEILFLSDVAAELDAARAAGLATALCCRPENPTPPAGHGHPEFSDFGEILLTLAK